jgi:hypothetical protein
VADRLADERLRLAELSPGGRGLAAALDSARQRLARTPDGARALRLFAALTGPGGGGSDEVSCREEELLDLLVDHGLLGSAPDGRYLVHPLTALLGRSPDGPGMESG